METTVAIPTVGTEAYFTFKNPYNLFIKNTFNINSLSTKLKVISVISMRDMIRTDLRDPFTELYEPAGLSEVEYKQDLKNNVYLISFSLKTCDGVERYLRVPINYIGEVSLPSNVEYGNRILMLDLGSLPLTLDLTPLFSDLIDFVASRTGVTPEIKDVSIGEVIHISQQDHDTRETIRRNSVSVHKTLAIQLEESKYLRDQLLNRLEQLGIVLGTGLT